MKSQGNNYADDCKFGRDQAALAIDEAHATGNIPSLVRQIREMAAADSGVSIGFLFRLGEAAVYGLTDARELNL